MTSPTFACWSAMPCATPATGSRLAANGAEGLTLISSNVFDVMICDIRLPRVDGLTLFRRVRQESPGTDVILITAHAAVADAVAALKEGAYDYITKPFDIDEIILQMERIAAQRALKRELEQARAELSQRKSGRTGRAPSSAAARRCCGCSTASRPSPRATRPC